jgi:hypothetical protein
VSVARSDSLDGLSPIESDFALHLRADDCPLEDGAKAGASAPRRVEPDGWLMNSNNWLRRQHKGFTCATQPRHLSLPTTRFNHEDVITRVDSQSHMRLMIGLRWRGFTGRAERRRRLGLLLS